MTIKSWKSDLSGVTIEIDHDKCEGGGECADVCPVDIYQIVDGKAIVLSIDDCVECCACVDACPVKAINHSSCL